MRTAGTPHFFSASQIETYVGDCPRKWAWKYIAGIEAPPHASADLGTDVHAQLENYERGGSIDFSRPSGDIAASGLDWLPRPPLQEYQIEREFSFGTNSGLVFVGYKDLAGLDAGQFPGSLPEHVNIAAIADHKTTSDFRWAKTPETLATNIQAVLYAYEEMSFRRTDRIWMRWLYYRTRGSRASMPVDLVMTSAQAVEGFRKIERVALEMQKHVVSQISPLTLPPNVSACEKFGGCPYIHLCNLSPEQQLRGKMSNNSPVASTSDLLAKLNGPGVASVPVPAPAPAAITPEQMAAAMRAMSPEQVQSILGTTPAPAQQSPLLGIPGVTVSPSFLAQPLTPAPASAPLAVPSPSPLLAPAPLLSTIVQPGQINPPESVIAPELPAQGAPLLTAPVAPAPSLSGVLHPGLITPVTPPTAEAPAPKGRGGRPKGSRNKASGATTAPADATSGGYTLYVNCVPDSGADNLEDVFAAAHELFRSERPDKGDVTFLPYGEAAGAFRICVAAVLAKSPLEGDVFLDTHSQEAMWCASTIIAGASKVVRAR